MAEIGLKNLKSDASRVIDEVSAGAGAAGWRRRHDTGSNPVIILLTLAVIAVVLGFFAADTIENSPETFGAIVGIGLLAVVLDALFRRTADPRPTPV